MALPFDLRAYVVSLSPANDDADASTPESSWFPRDQAGRPSRSIILSDDVIAGVRARNVDAFRELVRVMYVPMVRFARTILGQREEAEDVVQEVLANLWDRANRWQPSANPVAYLFGSVRNQALNSTRRRTRELRRVQDVRVSGVGPEPETDVDPLARLINAEVEATFVRLVSTVLASCTERQRTAYDLRYRRGFTLSQIAEVLAITTKSAEQLVSRTTHVVMERLREQLELSR